MGAYLSIDSYLVVRKFLFPAPPPLRYWTRAQFQINAGGHLPPFVLYTPDGIFDNRAPILIHCHGNANDCEGQATKLALYARRWKCTILSWEYAGYGPRAASEYPSADSMRADILALYDFLCYAWDIPQEKIFVFGHSIGTGPAVWLAAQKPRMGGVILQSAYTSIRDVAAHYNAWLGLVCPRVFDSLALMPSVSAPLLLIHGERDTLIPVTQGMQLREAATASARCTWHPCPFGTHNSWDVEVDVLAPVEEFLEACKSRV